MNAVRLYKKYKLEELVQLEKSLCDDPSNRSPAGSFNIYTKSARRKMGEIHRAIAWHLRDRRVERGEAVNDAGYAGPKKKKR